MIDDRTGDFPGVLKSRTFKFILVDKNLGTGTGTAIKANKVFIYKGKKVEIKL
jgi:alpha-D-xyloside xylohydrolase